MSRNVSDYEYRVICFDLEGPLSPQDNAYEVMRLIENGDQIFEVLSKYDDLLALENRVGYEPGDTLALIVPFLLSNNITEKDISRVSAKAKIVNGAKELISMCRDLGWKTYIISTSYEQHAYSIGARLGVNKENIICTSLQLDKLKKSVSEDIAIIKKAEDDILKFYENMDKNKEEMIARLDEFFYKELPKTSYGDVFSKVKVVGGMRKVEAMLKIAQENKVKLRDIIVVGDSITDSLMLKKVKEENGIAIVFNGNSYAVPYANLGLASMDIRFLQIIVNALTSDKDVIKIVKEWEKNRTHFAKGEIPYHMITPEIKEFLENVKIPKEKFPYFNYLEGASFEKLSKVIEIHQQFRKWVRGEAAKLG
ncbi:MAG TPA: hypothetical protein EYP22_07100 [Methanosarcinales archaeon]|nr:hypothetical protein [Methanosarcinales archaeon]